MANRSSFQSVLPRSIKRMLSLGRLMDLQDPHRYGEAKRIFMNAHKHHQAFKGKRLDQEIVKEIAAVTEAEVT